MELSKNIFRVSSENQWRRIRTGRTYAGERSILEGRYRGIIYQRVRPELIRES